MALGLSVIFGVVRVVNFAHGEMMTIAMYVAIVAFNTLGLDPLVMAVPLAAVLVALALIIVNVLLIVFGPDARNVQTSYAFDSFALGSLIVDATKLYAAALSLVIAALLFAFFRFAPLGKAIRACAD